MLQSVLRPHFFYAQFFLSVKFECSAAAFSLPANLLEGAAAFLGFPASAFVAAAFRRAPSLSTVAPTLRQAQFPSSNRT
jgi:hypothetical protein